MNYTEKPTTVEKPSRKLQEYVKELRDYKHAQLDKLRKQPSCTFEVYL